MSIIPHDNEKELLEYLIAAGDEMAFASFYHKYYNILRPFIWKHLPTQEDAEEVMQQVFVRAWLHRDKLPEITNVKAWLFKVASREYLSHIRNRIQRRIQLVTLEDNDQRVPIEINTATSPLPLKELTELILKAVNMLSPQRRLIFNLSRQEHLTIQEIAEKLNLAPKTIKNTLTAALAQVRDHLAAEGYWMIVLLACC